MSESRLLRLEGCLEIETVPKAFFQMEDPQAAGLKSTSHESSIYQTMRYPPSVQNLRIQYPRDTPPALVLLVIPATEIFSIITLLSKNLPCSYLQFQLSFMDKFLSEPELSFLLLELSLCTLDRKPGLAYPAMLGIAAVLPLRREELVGSW